MLRAAGGGLRSPKVGDWGQVIHTRFSKQMRFLLHCIGGPIPLPSQAMQPLDHLSLNLFIVVCEEGTIWSVGSFASSYFKLLLTNRGSMILSELLLLL